MSSITKEALISAVFTVLKKRGDDFVYRREARPENWLELDEATVTCSYSEDEGETGSCLFGSAVIDELHLPYEEEWEGSVVRGLLGYLDLDFDLDEERDFTDLLDDAQEMQDRGRRYGEVREYLEARLSQDGTVFA